MIIMVNWMDCYWEVKLEEDRNMFIRFSNIKVIDDFKKWCFSIAIKD